MENHEILSSQIKLFFRQQAELYGEEYFLLGIRTPPAQQHATAAPVLRMQTESAAPVKRDMTNKELLEQFNADFKDCSNCGLSEGRTKIVLGAGSPFAKVVLIGEGPGKDEDLKGLPFVGAAGQILERMMKKMGFSRQEVYITNIIKCRPPQNRNPMEDEIVSCSPLLEKQISIIKPKFIFCLGKVAANTLLKNEASLGSLRKKVYDYNGAKMYVTYHPAALLREKSLFWDVFEDMKFFRQAYDKEVGDKPPIPDMARKN
ncbi:MAG: uracil-DNA glycosylase [bacterium]